MYQPTRRTVIGVIGSTLLPCLADDKPADLIGKWSINLDKSSSDRYALPEAMSMTVEQSEGHISLDQTFRWHGPDSETVKLAYATDGSESVNKLEGTTLRSTAKWQDSRLTIDWQAETGNDRQTGKSVLSLGDGGTLTYATSATDATGTYSVIFVFTKTS